MGTEKALDDTQWGEAFPYVDRKRMKTAAILELKRGVLRLGLGISKKQST